jgi:hypothetical protein
MSNASAPHPVPPDQPLREAPAVLVRSTCPTCGWAAAVVFPLLTDGHPPEAAPLVCLLCCPTRPNA